MGLVNRDPGEAYSLQVLCRLPPSPNPLLGQVRKQGLNLLRLHFRPQVVRPQAQLRGRRRPRMLLLRQYRHPPALMTTVLLRRISRVGRSADY